MNLRRIINIVNFLRCDEPRVPTLNLSQKAG